MANMLEDGMTSMMESFLENAGKEFVYVRDTSSDNVTMHKRPQLPVMSQIGDGQWVEMMQTDFLTDPDNLPFGEPLRGDLIKDGNEVYSVETGTNGKVFRKLADHLMRIHTKRIQ